MTRSLLFSALLSVLLSCGGGGAPVGIAEFPDQGQLGRDSIVFGDLREADEVQGPVDMASDEAKPEEPLPRKCPGEAHCPCTDNAECYSGFCIETQSGYECAEQCMENSECPEGFSCVPCGTIGGDTVFCCVSPFVRLCHPCRNDSECLPPLGYKEKKYLCIEYGPEGKFCGVECSDDTDCPENYECSEIKSGESTVKQCIPSNGSVCPCTDKMISGGFITDCYIENEFGRCYGTRRCDTECSAKEPRPEVCNLEDDDCDGKVDEDVPTKACEITNEYGTCPGQTKCIAGEEICFGRQPSVEVCNGVDDDCDGATDEDFPDLDKDLIADCVDPDIDGDGVANAADNCPTVANPGQEDLDLDGLGDACDPDIDGDGDPNVSDCSPLNPSISHLAKEKCGPEGMPADEDCDGLTDEEGALGCIYYYEDYDNDGFGGVSGKCLCQPMGVFSAVVPGDCDDTNPLRNPGVEETCETLFDDDCDGNTNEENAISCLTYYFDNDGDGFGVDTLFRCLCAPLGKYSAQLAGDCDDGNIFVKPGAAEVCNGRDDNCNGTADEGCPASWGVFEFASVVAEANFDGIVLLQNVGSVGQTGYAESEGLEACFGLLCWFY